MSDKISYEILEDSEININSEFYDSIKEAMKLIAKQFEDIVNNDIEFYGGCKYYVSNEQMYVSDEERIHGGVYIVVKFLSANINFGNITLPITIEAVSERNNYKKCQKLLMEYASTYNMVFTNDMKIKQTYTTPQVMYSFEELDYGFRTNYIMSGTLLINNKVLEVTRFEIKNNNNEYEEINVTSFQKHYNASLTPRKISGKELNDNMKTVGMMDYSISYYSDNSYLSTELLKIESGERSGNKSFKIKISYTNGGIVEKKVIVGSFSNSHDRITPPICNVSFKEGGDE